MRSLTLRLEADNLASATVTGTNKGHTLKLEVDPEMSWDREGLLKLAAALKGIGGMLPV